MTAEIVIERIVINYGWIDSFVGGYLFAALIVAASNYHYFPKWREVSWPKAFLVSISLGLLWPVTILITEAALTEVKIELEELKEQQGKEGDTE